MFFIVFRFLLMALVIGVVVYVFLRWTRKDVLTGEDQDKRMDKRLVQEYKEEIKKDETERP